MDTLNLQWRMLTGLRRVQENAERAMQPFCTRHGLTPVALRIIMTLHCEGPMTVSALARCTCMAGTNNSSLCKRLAQQGFVERRRGQADERQVVVSLSPAGKTLAKELEEASDEMYKDLADRVDGKDIESFLTSLDRLVDMLNDEKETAS